MKAHITKILVGLLLLVASASAGLAQVKTIRMEIAGYLCGF